MSQESLQVARAKAIENLRRRIAAGGFALALSGGGHRATLFALGAFLAIADRRMGENLIQVASVSGGSIASAFVASRLNLATNPTPEEFDKAARELGRVVAKTGVITIREVLGWVVVPLVAVSVVAALVAKQVAATTSSDLAKLIAVAVVFVGVLFVLGAFGLLLGKVVEWQLRRRYFGNSVVSDQLERSALGKSEIEHVFCTTDLVSGLPFYVSTANGGTGWRRLRAEKVDVWSDSARSFETFNLPRTSLAGIVRASAGFPGIPPLKFDLGSEIGPLGSTTTRTTQRRIAFLADGGIWNNLATQVLREDAFLGSLSVPDEHGICRPCDLAPSEIPLVIVDGSANLSSVSPGWFRIPLIAQIAALLRVAGVLSHNTVLPRKEAFVSAFQRNVSGQYQSYKNDVGIRRGFSFDIVVDLSHTRTMWLPMSWQGVFEDTFDQIRRDIGRSVPVATVGDWDALRNNNSWEALTQRYGHSNVVEGTHLGLVSAMNAKTLVLKGYLNTFMASLFIKRIDQDDLAALERVEARVTQYFE